MTSKTQFRIKMALYAVILIVAELLQTSVFGSMSFGLVPSVMPVAVSCISVCEGAERGSIFGLAGGCLWAWSTRLTFYGAWCILLLTATGILAGIITDRYLLQGIKTALSISAGAGSGSMEALSLPYGSSFTLPESSFRRTLETGAANPLKAKSRTGAGRNLQTTATRIPRRRAAEVLPPGMRICLLWGKT